MLRRPLYAFNKLLCLLIKKNKKINVAF